MTPKGLMSALKWGTPGHRRIYNAVKERLGMSQRRMADRYEQIGRNEERFQAYIPASENDKLRKQRRESSGIPAYRTIEVPYSYAVLMTAHTYYTSVFLSRAPVFQVTGRHGESEQNTQAVEAILDYQRMVGEMMVPLFIWLLDPGKAGFGVIGHHWDEKFVTCRKVVEEPVTFFGLQMGNKMRQTEVVEKYPSYRGNKIYNVRPQDFFPDPRVTMRFFQKGEFVARYVENSWFDVMAGGKAGKYFNIDQLKKMRSQRDNGSQAIGTRDMGGAVTQLPNDSSLDFRQDVPPGFIRSYELYVRLSPKDWQFGPEEDPEIWCLTVSTNGVVYGAEPVGEYHGDFPFDIIEHEPEGYSMFSRSMLEVSEPLADIITWLVNTHFYNVRQTMNNQFVVDPSMVVMKDLLNPNPGKLIRLKDTAYGRDVRTILTQLQTVDVTKQNMGDLQLVADFIQRVTGVTDTTMGMLPSKSHTTATAVRTSSSFGVNRMKTNCEYYSAMGWSPFVQKLISRTQQYMDFEQVYRVAGDLAQYGKPFTQVDPSMIAGAYDFVPVDGTMPIDRFAQANLWQMLMGQLTKFPQIMQTYDMAKIFAWVAGLAGIKNIAQFRLVPDGQMQNQVQAGNVVPISTAMQDTGIGKQNLNEPQQIPGLGATG